MDSGEEVISEDELLSDFGDSKSTVVVVVVVALLGEYRALRIDAS